MDLTYILGEIGLSKQETNVYLAALKLGVAKASAIATKAQIKREAAYHILKVLEEKGFASETIQSGVKCYTAVNPQRILEIIEEEKERKKSLITEILPELNSLQKSAIEPPKIEIYEGIAGIKSAVSKLVEKQDQEICALIGGNILEFMPYFHPQFRRKRKSNKIFLKAITEKTKTMEELKKKDNEELRQTRFNTILSNFNDAFYILSDSILILKANKKQQIGIYIKDESIAKLQRKVFHEIWNKSTDQ